jgi:hypothetical protein
VLEAVKEDAMSYYSIPAPRPVSGRLLLSMRWLALVPHTVVLATLWVRAGALTLVESVATLALGRCPARVETARMGVLRRIWLVGYEGYLALGTNRYRPFRRSLRTVARIALRTDAVRRAG